MVLSKQNAALTARLLLFTIPPDASDGEQSECPHFRGGEWCELYDTRETVLRFALAGVWRLRWHVEQVAHTRVEETEHGREAVDELFVAHLLPPSLLSC